MRAWSIWTCAVLFMAAFAAGSVVFLADMGWFDADVLASVMPRVAPIELSSARVTIMLVFFVMSHALPRLLPKRRSARAQRDVGLAWSLAFCLAIAGLGFDAQEFSFHGPQQHPLEWWVFFAASVVALASHVPRRMGFEHRNLVAPLRGQCPSA